MIGPLRGFGRWISAHKAEAAFVAAILLGALVFMTVWFQPHKIFIEQTVDEEIPPPRAASTSEGAEQPRTANRFEVLAQGSFSSLEHETTGTAKIVELEDGRHFLRLEDLATSNGPDLRVYLSEIPASDDWFAYGERFLDLGALKGNLGNQNYEIPRGADLSGFKSAVIWCRRFTVGFGVAGLS